MSPDVSAYAWVNHDSCLLLSVYSDSICSTHQAQYMRLAEDSFALGIKIRSPTYIDNPKLAT